MALSFIYLTLAYVVNLLFIQIVAWTNDLRTGILSEIYTKELYYATADTAWGLQHQL